MPEPAPHADAPHDASATAPAPSPVIDAAAPADSGVAHEGGASATSTPPPTANVKIVTIGMHVAGGPFDEPTKEPFKKAVEPHFPEIATCWSQHLSAPKKQIDVGVDLLIEPAGGRPKVSNPRSTLEKSDAGADAFVPCVIAVFEAVEFPKLEGRGRTGVSYSLRFTRR